MTTRKHTSHRPHATARHVAALTIAALIVPVLPLLSPAPAEAEAGTPALAATADGSTAPPATLPAGNGYDASTTTRVTDFNTRCTGLRQRYQKLGAQKQALAQRQAAVKSGTDTLQSEEAAAETATTAHNAKADAYNAEVDTYNASPHNFTLPDQQAQYDAAQARKAQLDAEGNALQKEADAENAQHQQLAEQAQQLATTAEQLASDEESYDTDVTSYDTDVQQLATTRTQLLQAIITAIQEQPSSPADEATDMARGGDAPAPAQAATDQQSAGQAPETAPGGDTASPVDRIAAIASYAATNGVSVEYQPVVAQMSPGTISRLPASDTAQLPLSADYDGLLPEPNGHYQAIELQDSTGAPSSTSPGQAAFDNAIAHGGRATSTINGRPVIIDRTKTIPKHQISGDGKCTSPQDTDVKYGDRDMAHGGRATTMWACLDKDYVKAHPGTDTESGIDPPGYAWANRYARHLGLYPRQLPKDTVNKCHLLARQLSGSGTDLDNLVTCGAAGNSYVGRTLRPYSMNSFEDEVKGALARGFVTYQVTPGYEGDRTVPSVFLMTFTARDDQGRQVAQDEDLVSNTMKAGDHALVNLGLIRDSRTSRPVPTAADG